MRLLTVDEATTLWPDGIWWVELAPVRDGTEIVSAIATVLQLSTAPGRRLEEGLIDALSERRLLLILDNCEHVVDSAAALVASLLAQAPDVRVLATSRERLQVEGESVWPAPALSTVATADVTRDGAQAAAEVEAVRLFVERTRAVLPTFTLTTHNAPLVARLCERLDGLPLALELAAAVVPVFGLEGLDARLDDALAVLSRGRRTASARHQTLRAVLDWSYALLDTPARLLLGRLAVFRGAVTLDAIESVCAGDDISLPRIDVLAALSRLVEHSLVDVRDSGGDTRYRVLETVRQYGRQQAATEWDALCAQHSRWLIAHVNARQDALNSAARGPTVAALQALVDEIRFALDWATGPSGDAMLAAELTGGLVWFWISGIAWDEGRAIIARTLRAIDAQGVADVDRPLDEQVIIASIFYGEVGLAYFRGDLPHMFVQGARALALLDQIDTKPERTPAHRKAAARGRALVHQLVGLAHALSGDEAPALVHLDAAFATATAAGEHWLAAVMRMRRALGHLVLRRLDAAESDYLATIPALEAVGERWFLSLTYEGLAMVALLREDPRLALRRARTSILVLENEPDPWFISRSLDTMAAIHVREGETVSPTLALQAAELYGAGEALRRHCGAGVIGPDVERHARTREILQRVLGDARFAQVVAEAQRITLADVFRRMYEEDALDVTVEMPIPEAVNAPVTGASRGEPDTSGRVLELRLLNGVALRRTGGETAEPVPVGKVRELLAYLALHPARSKEEIGLALWPDASAAQLRNIFHVTLHHLRRLLGPESWIPFVAEGYRLDRAPDGGAMLIVDVDQVQAAAHAVLETRRRQRPTTPAERRAWSATLRMGGDELLGTVAMGEWLEPCRDRYRLMWGDAMESLVRILMDAGEVEEALDVAAQLLGREPLREAAHRLLIECHLARAEPSRAIEHYRRLERTLADAVGARPSAETRALLARATDAV